MVFLKSFFINFLIVFFADHILPGMQVMDLTRLPHIGGDLLFSLALGFLNALIYPGLKIFHKEATGIKIALVALILNFAAYAFVLWLPLGIHFLNIEGYLLVCVVVALGGFTTNFLELRRFNAHKPEGML